MPRVCTLVLFIIILLLLLLFIGIIMKFVLNLFFQIKSLSMGQVYSRNRMIYLTRTKKRLKMNQEVGILLEKRANTNGVGIST